MFLTSKFKESVLDRTLGKTARIELSMNAAEQTLDILRELHA